MVEEKREDYDELRKEIQELKRRLDEVLERERPGRHLGIAISDFVNELVEGVMAGVSSEIEKSVLLGPYGIIISRRKGKRPEPEEKIDIKKTLKVLNALANEHRLHILTELMTGGKYAGQLAEELKDISPGTLSSHLDILQDAGLIVQEADRGRYLITIPGRMALKFAGYASRLTELR